MTRERIKLPLEGVRIMAFSVTWAGPVASGLLADFGAEVIKVESNNRIDDTRLNGPFPSEEIDIEQSGSYAYFNRNKRGILLNMVSQKGQELARRLIKISDVVLNNFSTQAVGKWEMDYSRLKEIKPDIISIDLHGLGGTGPFKSYITYGPTLMCLSGLTHLWRTHNTSEPIVSGGYPDFIAGVHAAIAVMGALHYRARTGKGQHIDLSQLEATASMLGPLILEYFINQREPQILGNRSLWMAPHNCYRCKKPDTWCAIAISNEKEWKSFCKALGEPPWTKEERFADMADRLKNVEELDKYIEGWTMNFTPHQVMRILQNAGVPAGAVQNAEEVYRDYHLRDQGFFVEVEHPRMGVLTQPGMNIRLSKSRGDVYRHAPLLGQDNNYVFAELLGLSEKEIRKLQEEKVIY
jgi:crotonobetainyl-CoA:carnitine CoA-transferase CaiB-like acyl-CoA transferase